VPKVKPVIWNEPKVACPEIVEAVFVPVKVPTLELTMI
jgi:hypothetical protein